MRENNKPQKIEQLVNFPFDSWKQFRTALLDGVCSLGIDRGVARQWATGGIYSPRWLNILMISAAYLPFVSAISFIVFAIFKGNWLSLLFLPLAFIAFFTYYPGPMTAVIRIPLKFFTVGLFLYGLFWGSSSALSFSLLMLSIWVLYGVSYSVSVRKALQVAGENEELLSLLWEMGSLNVLTIDGKTYYSKGEF